MSRQFTVQYLINDENSEEFKTLWDEIHRKLRPIMEHNAPLPAVSITGFSDGNLFKKLNMIEKAFKECGGELYVATVIPIILNMPDDKLEMIERFDGEEIIFKDG